MLDILLIQSGQPRPFVWSGNDEKQGLDDIFITLLYMYSMGFYVYYVISSLIATFSLMQPIPPFVHGLITAIPDISNLTVLDACDMMTSSIDHVYSV